jgi:hypothetical protein
LRKSLELAGYPLLTNNMALQGAIEVYPHPALVELAGAPIRLPYKASKMASYWPTITDPKRRCLRLYELAHPRLALLAPAYFLHQQKRSRDAASRYYDARNGTREEDSFQKLPNKNLKSDPVARMRIAFRMIAEGTRTAKAGRIAIISEGRK